MAIPLLSELMAFTLAMGLRRVSMRTSKNNHQILVGPNCCCLNSFHFVIFLVRDRFAEFTAITYDCKLCFRCTHINSQLINLWTVVYASDLRSRYNCSYAVSAVRVMSNLNILNTWRLYFNSCLVTNVNGLSCRIRDIQHKGYYIYTTQRIQRY